MTFDRKGIASVIASARMRRDADPLASFQFPSPRHRLAVERIYAEIETYARGPNKSAKTTTLVAAFASIARGRKVLDDLPLPEIRLPNVGVVLMQSYGQGAESVVGSYKRAIGKGGSKAKKLPGGMGNVGLMMVQTPLCQHANGDECDECSKIYFISGEGALPAGFQVDWVHADEPPNEEHWRELRFRSRGNAPFFLGISATPLRKNEYAWLQRDFAGCLEIPVDGRVEMVWGLDDNKFLSERYKASLRKKAKNDPFLRARLYGEYVDITGTCPFDYGGLARWERAAEPPRRAAVVASPTDDQETVWVLKDAPNGNIEIWAGPECFEGADDDRFILAADPSSGVRNPDKTDEQQILNPASLNMVSVRHKRHILRFNGYIPAKELGVMARAICTAYGDRVLIVPEMNGGWGETFLLGFGLDYPWVYRERRVSEVGTRERFKVGWYQSQAKKATIVSALQSAVGTAEAPGWLDCRSSAIVSKLKLVQARDDEKKKSVTWDEGRGGRGSHAEDLITLGMSAHLLMRAEFQWWGDPEPERELEGFERLRMLARQQEARPDDMDYGGREPRRA